MLEGYKIITITHRSTNLRNIENYIVHTNEEETIQSRLAIIKNNFDISELMYLATCNRVMYFIYTESVAFDRKVPKLLEAINPSLTDFSLSENVTVFSGEKAIQHFFEVGGSIDSLVVGEREILRQIREAYYQSKDWNLIGDNIRIAYKRAVVSAKSIYSDTRIGEKPISIVSLAMGELAKTRIQKNHRILLIGAGQTNIIVSKFLKKYEYNNVHVFNRTLAKAKRLAASIGGTAHTKEELHTFKKGFDCLIVCTGIRNAWIDTSLYSSLLNGEKDSKVVIDLAIPNNIDTQILNDFPVEYIQIEGLRIQAQKNKKFREAEVGKAKELVKEQFLEFKKLYQGRLIARALESVPTEVREVKDKAINEVFRKDLDKLDHDSVLLVTKMLEYMEKKCIGIPMKAAKSMIIAANT